MKASEKKIIDLFSEVDTVFSIPVYQRDYNWQEKHCQLLFDNILKVGKDMNVSSHFIESIVYIHDGVYSIGEKEFYVIDGQQRMTTITLLFLALYYKLKETNKRAADKIYEQYIINKYSEKEMNLKLLPPEENLIILNKISKNFFNELEEYQDRNMLKNYIFFKNSVENLSGEEIECFLKGIEKLIYVDIALEKGKDDPQKIFESLNSTGLDLSQGDLIKNYILMDLEKTEQNKIYKDIWLPIENNCKVSDGSKIISYISDFIRDYLTLKNSKIPTKSKVFEEFKKFYQGKTDDILEDIKIYSYFYAIIRKPKLEKDLQLRKELEYLKILDQTVITPFLIGVLRDCKEEKISKKETINILKLLQSYIWRRYITGEPSNALSKLFQGMYSKTSKDGKYYNVLESILLNQGFPTDEELKQSLKLKPLYKDKDKLNYVFQRLENYYHNEPIDFHNGKIIIGHIFPQKPNKDWKEKYSKTEFEYMKRVKDTISNLTLIGSDSNLRSKSFSCKRDDIIYGYKNSKLYLNGYLGKLDEWDLLKMAERFENLYKDIIQIWRRPEMRKIGDVE